MKTRRAGKKRHALFSWWFADAIPNVKRIADHCFGFTLGRVPWCQARAMCHVVPSLFADDRYPKVGNLVRRRELQICLGSRLHLNPIIWKSTNCTYTPELQKHSSFLVPVHVIPTLRTTIIWCFFSGPSRFESQVCSCSHAALSWYVGFTVPYLMVQSQSKPTSLCRIQICPKKDTLQVENNFVLTARCWKK